MRCTTRTLIFACWFGIACAPAAWSAQDAGDADTKWKPQTSEQKEPADPNYTVKVEPLKIDVAFAGQFDTTNVTEISITPESWAELTVQWAIEHGRRVKKGAKVLIFNTRKIDMAIADLEAEIESARLALQQMEASLNLLKESVPKSLAAARRAADEAAEDLARFRKTERADSIQSVEQDVWQARNSLEYQKEELRQLEKMYKADDLTEETEEIILTRARHRLQTSQYMLDRTIEGQRKFLEVSLPRREAGLVRLVEQTAHALEEANATLPASLREKTLGLQRMQTGYQRQREKLTHLRRDRNLLTVVAPVEGIVYYGQAAGGKWPSAATVAKLLGRGALAKPNQVLLTIVGDGQLLVRGTLDEKDLHQVRKGAPTEIKPVAFPDVQLEGRVGRISSIPTAPGKFDVEVTFKPDKKSQRIRAGMGCKAAIQVVRRDEAMLVPKSAVKSLDQPNRGYVYVVADDGSQKKRTLRIGRLYDGRREILSGLEVGEKIVAKNPDGS
jgi:multidrug efflux pump subunit AcrA (membrane-fusion protein)